MLNVLNSQSDVTRQFSSAFHSNLALSYMTVQFNVAQPGIRIRYLICDSLNYAVVLNGKENSARVYRKVDKYSRQAETTPDRTQL
jgi:hypothetical protein